MKKEEKIEKNDGVCKICKGQGYFFDKKTGIVQTCTKCLKKIGEEQYA